MAVHALILQVAATIRGQTATAIPHTTTIARSARREVEARLEVALAEVVLVAVRVVAALAEAALVAAASVAAEDSFHRRWTT